jgi:hypothetical protein
MKTLTVRLYSFSELSENAQERVLRDHSKSVYSEEYSFTLDECMDSLRSICKAMGTPLLNWSIGPFSTGNFAKVYNPSWGYDEIESSQKALALFLKVLIAHGYSRPKTFKEMQFPCVCGFTGVCFDDDISEFIWKELLDGSEWMSAVDNCAEFIARIEEKDLEWRSSKEAFLEILEGEEIYSESGEIF